MQTTTLMPLDPWQVVPPTSARTSDDGGPPIIVVPGLSGASSGREALSGTRELPCDIDSSNPFSTSPCQARDPSVIVVSPSHSGTPLPQPSNNINIQLPASSGLGPESMSPLMPFNLGPIQSSTISDPVSNWPPQSSFQPTAMRAPTEATPFTNPMLNPSSASQNVGNILPTGGAGAVSQPQSYYTPQSYFAPPQIPPPLGTPLPGSPLNQPVVGMPPQASPMIAPTVSGMGPPQLQTR